MIHAPMLKPTSDPHEVPLLYLDNANGESNGADAITPRREPPTGVLDDMDVSTHADSYWVLLKSMMGDAELRIKVDRGLCLADLNSQLCSKFNRPTLTTEVALVAGEDYYDIDQCPFMHGIDVFHIVFKTNSNPRIHVRKPKVFVTFKAPTSDAISWWIAPRSTVRTVKQLLEISFGKNITAIIDDRGQECRDFFLVESGEVFTVLF